MSQQRVELVKAGFEAWNREDPAWVLEHMSPEVEWMTPPTDPSACRSSTGARRRWPSGACETGTLDR